MVFLQLVPLLLSILILAAHFLRAGQYGLVLVCLLSYGLLFVRRSWVPIVFRIGMLGSVFVWAQVALELIQVRQALGEPWTRMAIILGAVGLLTGASQLVFGTKRLKKRYSPQKDLGMGSAGAFWISAFSMGVVQLKVAPPMLLAERFVAGGGWVEIFGLSIYAAWLTEKILTSREQSAWRRRLWLGFSAIFFAQLTLGLVGIERLLMSGELHLPVPALIISGPLFRGEGLFMPILLGATLLLVGPAWCSFLCYIGAWDGAAAELRRKPKVVPQWLEPLRWVILATAIGVPLGLRALEVNVTTASWIAGGFGLLGLVVMFWWSRRTGSMLHCTVYCPIGLVANTLGKLSPFRIAFTDGCDGCGACRRSCRYRALEKQHIERRSVGMTCTLCGDCLESCNKRALGYRFLRMSPERSRTLFIAIVVGLHAVFVGVARL